MSGGDFTFQISACSVSISLHFSAHFKKHSNLDTVRRRGYASYPYFRIYPARHPHGSRLQRRTVYLLQGNGDDIVVKNENITMDDSKHFDLSKKAMGVVDKNVKSSEKLTDNELNALIGYVRRQKAFVQMQLKDRLPGAADDLDLALQKLSNPATKNVWYKMPNLRMVNMQHALESQVGATEGGVFTPSEAVPQSSKPMREFLKVLKGTNGLESLGKVIAIDIFSGNNDRIIPDGGRRAIIGNG
jgi:hypothetical protein